MPAKCPGTCALAPRIWNLRLKTSAGHDARGSPSDDGRFRPFNKCSQSKCFHKKSFLTGSRSHCLIDMGEKKTHRALTLVEGLRGNR
jgi:hypothetical protein